MTTSISLRVYFRPLFSSFPKHSKILWREKQERKLKNIRFEFLETQNSKGFRGDEIHRSRRNFECCTFDHSDNSPCLFSSGFLSGNLLKNSLERKQERRQKIFDFEIFCVEEYQGESGGRNSQLLPKFRVRAVMTTSIPIHICAFYECTDDYNQSRGKNQVRRYNFRKFCASGGGISADSVV